ncbi:unnamed protein product [Sphagnum balticum]
MQIRQIQEHKTLILAIGAAYATGKSAEGIGIAWVKRRRLGMRALVPIVMAGIIGIYGLVVAVVIIGKIGRDYTVFQFVPERLFAKCVCFSRGFSHFVAGLVCGGCSMGAGYAVGISGDSGRQVVGRRAEDIHRIRAHMGVGTVAWTVRTARCTRRCQVIKPWCRCRVIY